MACLLDGRSEFSDNLIMLWKISESTILTQICLNLIPDRAVIELQNIAGPEKLIALIIGSLLRRKAFARMDRMFLDLIEKTDSERPEFIYTCLNLSAEQFVCELAKKELVASIQKMTSKGILLTNVLRFVLKRKSKSNMGVVLKTLVASRGDINHIYEDGYCPLDIAVKRKKYRDFFQLVELGADPMSTRSNGQLLFAEAGRDTRYHAQLIITTEDNDPDLEEAFRLYSKHPDRSDVIYIKNSMRVEGLCLKHQEDIRSAAEKGLRIRVIFNAHGPEPLGMNGSSLAFYLHQLLSRYGLTNDNPPFRVNFASCATYLDRAGDHSKWFNTALDCYNQLFKLGMITTANVSLGDVIITEDGSKIRGISEDLNRTTLWQGKDNHLNSAYRDSQKELKAVKALTKEGQIGNLKAILYKDDKGETRRWLNPNPDGHRNQDIP